VELTTAEFDLLWLLASAGGTVLTRDAILASLRGLEYNGLDRSIDIGVSRLRAKLNDSRNPPEKIKTVRGKGYLFVPDAW
jgi:DNA-binding response OmpR family regulator